MSGFITRPPPKKSTGKLVQRPNIRPPDVEHPKVMVGYKVPPKQFQDRKKPMKALFKKPPPLTDQQKLEVLERINKIKNRI